MTVYSVHSKESIKRGARETIKKRVRNRWLPTTILSKKATSTLWNRRWWSWTLDTPVPWPTNT